ncbi:hypothetical protein BME24068_02141 [Burkholderia metallica]|nr:hypothetical protein BME24068_02141 [Burkholderia metallica]
MSHFRGQAAACGHHPGIGPPTLRTADTIRANAVRRPDRARRPGVTGVETLNTGVAT